MNKNDRCVIFDLGGVFIPDSTVLLNRTIGEIVGISEEKISKYWNDALPELFTGKMKIKELYMSLFGENVDADLLLNKHIEIYKSKYKVNDSMLGFLDKLNTDFTTACLTNTEYEVSKVNNELGLYGYFQYKFLSTELKMMKPNSDIFEFAINELSTSPENIIFVDDKIENISTAERMGLKTVLFETTDKTQKELLQILNC